MINIESLTIFCESRSLRLNIVDLLDVVVVDGDTDEVYAKFEPVISEGVVNGYRFVGNNDPMTEMKSLYDCLSMIGVISENRKFRSVIDLISVVTRTKYR